MRDFASVRIPATTANLGPGFDCLAMALEMWNEAAFSVEGSGIHVNIAGAGQDTLPKDETNLVARAALLVFDRAGVPAPRGLQIACINEIPTGSGLGSSAAGVLAGLLGANALLGKPFSREEILAMAVEMEGHPDNAAAALYGGLVVVISTPRSFLTHRYDLPRLPVAVVLPEFDFPTRAAREALPKTVPLSDAVFNLGRTALVVEALRSADYLLLEQVMDDRLHQPYRLPLIPGAEAARQAALRAGAAAVVLSGAGPSLLAIGGRPASAAAAMGSAFDVAGIPSQAFLLETCNAGAQN